MIREANEAKSKPKQIGPSVGQYNVPNVIATKAKPSGGGFSKATRNTSFPRGPKVNDIQDMTVLLK